MALFETKKKAPEEGPVSAATKRAPRYDSWANVSISGFEGEALLRNINLGGFCLESRTYVAISPGDVYTMHIAPEAPGEKGFSLQVQVRWVRCTEHNFYAGFAVSEQPKDRALEKYVDYLKSRAAAAS
jgi:hypothetical protein